MSSEIIRILLGRVADDLSLLREAAAAAEVPFELTLGSEAIDGIEKILADICHADFDRINISAAQVVRGLRRAISDHRSTTER